MVRRQVIHCQQQLREHLVQLLALRLGTYSLGGHIFLQAISGPWWTSTAAWTGPSTGILIGLIGVRSWLPVPLGIQYFRRCVLNSGAPYYFRVLDPALIVV